MNVSVSGARSFELIETVQLPDPENAVVSVIGLGYVGLPLMVGFAEQARTIGFDIDQAKVSSLQSGIDPSEQCSRDELLKINMEYTADFNTLAEADVLIVCVPTPVMQGNKPDYRPLLAATQIGCPPHEARCNRGL